MNDDAFYEQLKGIAGEAEQTLANLREAIDDLTVEGDRLHAEAWGPGAARALDDAIAALNEM